jgi:hypothetical protein
MVVGEDLPLADLLAVVLPLEEELGRKINPTCYTPEEFRRRRNEFDSFVNRVLAQPTLPLIGEVLEPAGAG